MFREHVPCLRIGRIETGRDELMDNRRTDCSIASCLPPPLSLSPPHARIHAFDLPFFRVLSFLENLRFNYPRQWTRSYLSFPIYLYFAHPSLSLDLYIYIYTYTQPSDGQCRVSIPRKLHREHPSRTSPSRLRLSNAHPVGR